MYKVEYMNICSRVEHIYVHPLLCATVAFNDFNSRLQLQQSRSITSAVLQQAYLKGHLMAVYLAMTAWSLGSLPPIRTECCL